MDSRKPPKAVVIDNYPVSLVPQAMRVPFISVALVQMGMLTALDQFILGAVLGHSMTLSGQPIAQLIAQVPAGKSITISAGITMTVGGSYCRQFLLIGYWLFAIHHRQSVLAKANSS